MKVVDLVGDKPGQAILERRDAAGSVGLLVLDLDAA